MVRADFTFARPPDSLHERPTHTISPFCDSNIRSGECQTVRLGLHSSAEVARKTYSGLIEKRGFAPRPAPRKATLARRNPATGDLVRNRGLDALLHLVGELFCHVA